MYKVIHLLADPEKTSVFNTEQEFVDFANRILIENNDNQHFAIHTALDAKDYIKEFCDNLQLVDETFSN